MRTTYVEAQWKSPSMQTWMREQLAAWNDDEGFACYMRDSLRIGGIKTCRELIALAQNTPSNRTDGPRG